MSDRDLLTARHMRLLRVMLWTAHVRTVMLLIAAIASIIVAIDAIMSWLP